MLSGEPHSTVAWQRGAIGEQKLGALLEPIRNEGFGVLHDRRIPGTKANIDHIVIGPAGVFVIDAKRYSGKLERRDRGSLFARDWRLYVGGRDRTRLVDAMAQQVLAVHQALLKTSVPDCRVSSVLCFVDGEVGLFQAPFTLQDVHVIWPSELGKLIRTDGPLELSQIEELERSLAQMLPKS